MACLNKITIQKDLGDAYSLLKCLHLLPIIFEESPTEK